MRSFAGTVACAAVVVISGQALAQVPQQVQWNPGLYGMLDQKDVPGIGRWACGPTSLTNSLVYLENRFGYNRWLIPDDNAANGMIDHAEMVGVAALLSTAAYMNVKPGVDINMGDDPYEYRRSPSSPPSQYPADDWTPGATPGQVAGGVTWQRFAFGKDKYFFGRAGSPVQSILRGQYTGPWIPNPAAPLDPQDMKDLRNFAPMAPGWLDTNATLNMREMFFQLSRGADIEIGWSWTGAAGGHFMTVTGYDWTLDQGMLDVFDAGDQAILHCIDPWGPGVASIVTATISNNAGVIGIDYAGGAAGNGASGSMRIWTSEIPGPGVMSLLSLGGLVALRRRR